MKLHLCPIAPAALLAFAALFNPAAAGRAATLTPYLIKDINPGTGSSNAMNLADVNGTLYFAATDGTTGTEIWKSDGTEAGTVLVKDINPAGNGMPTSPLFTFFNGSTLFAAEESIAAGTELWLTDGTSGGTLLLKDINVGLNGDSTPSNFGTKSIYNGELFFSATFDDTISSELWKTNGTEAGTIMVKDIHPTSGSDPNLFTVANGALLFAASDGNGTELWKTDGTEAGTVSVKDIRPGSSSSSPTNLTAIGNTLYFRANNGTNGVELWKSDGTEAGTEMVVDLLSGSGTGNLGGLTNFKGTLFFQATNGTSGQELWKSDGTAAGTVLVKDINPGSGNGVITGNTVMVPIGDSLFFQANDVTNGREMWVSDGTTAGTQMLANLAAGSASATFDLSSGVAAGDLFFFAASIPDGSLFDQSLYVTDGTTAGTVPIFTVQDLNTSALRITNLAFSGNHLFFRAPVDVSAAGVASNFELFAVNVVPEPGCVVFVALGCLFVSPRIRRRLG